MRYLQADDAKELLPSFLIKYVHANEEQNAVVATALPGKMSSELVHLWKPGFEEGMKP